MVRRCLLLLGLAGCADLPCEDLRTSPEGLALTEDEHATGWGEAACDDCHARDTLHRRACTPEVDLAEVREQADGDAPEACTGCHGDNGVEP